MRRLHSSAVNSQPFASALRSRLRQWVSSESRPLVKVGTKGLPTWRSARRTSLNRRSGSSLSLAALPVGPGAAWDRDESPLYGVERTRLEWPS